MKMMTSPHRAAIVKAAIAGSAKVQPRAVGSTKLNPVAVGSTKPKRVIADSAGLKPQPITATARQTHPALPGPAFDLPAAIASGAINEKQLIAVLTEMCRCVLSAQLKQEIGAAMN